MMKKVHKAAVATVLATLMLSSVNPVLAAGAGDTKPTGAQRQQPVVPAGMISEQQAIAALKAFFGEQANNLTNARADFGESPRFNMAVWHVYLEMEPEPGKIPTYLFADIDAKTGNVQHVQYQNAEWTGNKTPDKDEAVRIASEFLKAKRPDLDARVTVTDTSGGGGSATSSEDGTEVRWTHRTIRFNEMVNGVPFLSNAVEVQVDEYGHVVGFQNQMNFDSSKLPPRSLALPESKAKKVLADELKMTKQYTTYDYKRTEAGNYKLVERPVLGYRPNFVSNIDALTGKPIEDLYQFPIAEKQNESLKVTGTDGKWIAKDKEEAKQLVAKVLDLDLSKMVYQEEKERNRIEGLEIWSLNWHSTGQPKAGEPFYVGAAFDAKTGQLLNAYVQTERDEEQPKPVLSLAQAKAKALDVLKTQLGAGEHELFLLREMDSTSFKQLYPKWFDKSKNDYDQQVTTENRYGFYLALGHQGVPVNDQQYSASFDPATGRLMEVGIARNQELLKQLPDNTNTIGDKAAREKFLNTYQLQLAYLWPQFMDQYAPEGQLVYQLDRSNYHLDYIDAFTGEIVDVSEER